jgi:septal ring factor EnvC (AmiA/AmiB activator)
MRRRLPTILLIITLTLVTGCASYTARDAMSSITIPTTEGSDLPVTKHSLIVKEQEAEAAHIEEMSSLETIAILQAMINDLENTVAAYEQDDTIPLLQADIAAGKQLIDEQQAAITTLDEEIKALTEERRALLDRLTSANATLDEQQELLSQQEMVIALFDEQEEDGQTIGKQLASATQALAQQQQLVFELRGQVTQLTDELNALAEERRALVDRLTAANAALDEQAEDGQTIAEQLAAATVALEQQQRLVDEQGERITQLTEELRALSEEREALSSQLTIATAALDEQHRIEAAAEADRLQQEQLRLLAQAQEAARLEEERELARLIPPLSELTLPHRYVISSTVKVIPKGSILKTLLLPLSDVPWQGSDLADSVARSISDLEAPVIFVTGAMENVTSLVKRLAVNAVLLEGGAVITPLEVLEATKNSVQVRLNGEQMLRLSLANLVEYEVLSSFLDGEEGWKETQKRLSEPRLKTLLSIARTGLKVEPTILAGSLYEPSHQDWSSFSPISYRQVDYLWPLGAALEEEQFWDVYRLTHFSADTDSGNTIALGEIKERVDYLFTRKLLPLSSTIIPVGGESTPRDEEVQRWGIAASLLIP